MLRDHSKRFRPDTCLCISSHHTFARRDTEREGDAQPLIRSFHLGIDTRYHWAPGSH